MKSLYVDAFDLGHTLESGQMFRFEKEGKDFLVSHGNRHLLLRQDGHSLNYEGANEAFIKKFFSLDEKYEDILKSINRDEHLNKAMVDFYGLRIMKQDPWECLISFVCSQQSNIPRIKNNLKSISETFGKPIGRNAYSFPNPEEINDNGKLKKAKLGYRQKFVYDIARKVDLKKLRSKMSYGEAKDYLISLPGVGDKVAECVMLFSMGHKSAFPVDVWIDRVMKKLYLHESKLNMKQLQTVGKAYFGENAGYAQQFLYHWSRNNREFFKNGEMPTKASKQGSKEFAPRHRAKVRPKDSSWATHF